MFCMNMMFFLNFQLLMVLFSKFLIYRLGDLINVKLKPNQNPIVFSNDYEISFAGIERWYTLDTCKGGNALKLLKGKESCSFYAELINEFIELCLIFTNVWTFSY